MRCAVLIRLFQRHIHNKSSNNVRVSGLLIRFSRFILLDNTWSENECLMGECGQRHSTLDGRQSTHTPYINNRLVIISLTLPEINVKWEWKECNHIKSKACIGQTKSSHTCERGNYHFPHKMLWLSLDGCWKEVKELNYVCKYRIGLLMI